MHWQRIQESIIEGDFIIYLYKKFFLEKKQNNFLFISTQSCQGTQDVRPSYIIFIYIISTLDFVGIVVLVAGDLA